MATADIQRNRSVPPAWIKFPKESVTHEIPMITPTASAQNGQSPAAARMSPPMPQNVEDKWPSQIPPAREPRSPVPHELLHGPNSQTQQIPLHPNAPSSSRLAASSVIIQEHSPVRAPPTPPSQISVPRSAEYRPLSSTTRTASPLRLDKRYAQVQEIPLNRGRDSAPARNTDIRNTTEMSRLQNDLRNSSPPAYTLRPYTEPPQPNVRIPVEQIPLNFASIHPDAARPPGSAGGLSTHNAAWIEHEKYDDAKNRKPEKDVRSSWDVAGRLRQGFDYIGEIPLTEKEACRVYLLQPKPPHSPEKRDRVAQMLGKEYGVPPAVVREIWDTKCLPGSGAPLPLDPWKTEAMPPWMPQQPYEEPRQESQRVYRTTGPLTQPSEEMLSKIRVHGLPSHRLVKRSDGKITSTVCGRVSDPPAGVLDVLVVEASNLPVPHKYESILETSSIVPYVQVQVVHELADGSVVRDFLKTPAMDKGMLAHWKRSPLDPVFNQTLRFPGMIDGGADETREFVLSVHDKNGAGSGLLGVWKVPLKMLFQGAFGVEGWVDLKDEATQKPVDGFNRGKRCAVLVRAICRPLPNSVHEVRKEAKKREAEIKADAIYRKEVERIRLMEEKQRREQEEEEERMREEQHRRIQAAMEAAKRRQEEEQRLRQSELEAEADRLQSQERLLALEAEQAAAVQRMAAQEAKAREELLRDQRAREQAEFELRVEEEKERLSREVQNQTLEELMQKREQLLQIHQENERLEAEIQRAAAATALQRQRLLEEAKALDEERRGRPVLTSPQGSAMPMGVVPPNSIHDPTAAPPRTVPDEEEEEEDVDPNEVWKDPAKMLRLAGVEPWMERSDVEWVRNRPEGMALSRDFRMELVPGAVGALQGIASEGYEVVLVGEAKPWLAGVVSEALRTVGVVGPRGAVKEKNLLFCSSAADKLRIAKALGKVVAAVDDDWNLLKSYPSLGLGPGLILFNPNREELSSFNEDQRVWRAYKIGLNDALRKLADVQREVLVMDKARGVANSLDDQQDRNQLELRQMERSVVPELQHLLNKEPSSVCAVHTDLLPPLQTFDGLRGKAAATAVEPWLRVAEAMGVPNTDVMLSIVRDVDNPERGEALARKVNDGTALSLEGAPSVAALVAPGDVPAGKPRPLPPFYPLQSQTWHYPLAKEEAEKLPPSIKEAVVQRLFDWRAGLQDYQLGFGIGIDFAIADGLLVVNKLLPSGPAMRSGMIEEGMRLILVDGELLATAGVEETRKALATRIIECEESRRGQCAKRLETFRHMPPQTKATLADPVELAECGFSMSADKKGEPMLKCQYCGMESRHIPAGVDIWALHEQQCPYCPLVRARAGHQAPPETDALPRPSCLMNGLTLGFVTAETAAQSRTLSKEAFQNRVHYVWLCPEPADDKVAATDRGRVLIDISRVVMRLRYYETKALVEREPFRDSRLDDSVRIPLSALSLHKDMDEVVDQEGRTVYVDHEAKTTSLIPPRPFSPDVLPSGWSERRDHEGRVYYANDDQTKSQWEFPWG